jgi:hypothetical protein
METSNYRARSLLGPSWAWSGTPPFIDLDDAHPLAQAIVDTIRDPLLVLDQRLRVVTANRAFRQTFRMNRQDIRVVRFTGWASASGISPSFGCCWRTSRHSTGPWKITKSSEISPLSDAARCF